MRRQVSDDAESDEAINVHAKLERREAEAGEEGEEAVEAGDFVKEEREGY